MKKLIVTINPNGKDLNEFIQLNGENFNVSEAMRLIEGRDKEIEDFLHKKIGEGEGSSPAELVKAILSEFPDDEKALAAILFIVGTGCMTDPEKECPALLSVLKDIRPALKNAYTAMEDAYKELLANGEVSKEEKEVFISAAFLYYYGRFSEFRRMATEEPETFGKFTPLVMMIGLQQIRKQLEGVLGESEEEEED